MKQRYPLFSAKICTIFAILFFTSSWLRANTYYVSTSSDTGQGSLRSYIDTANNNPGSDTIVLMLSVHDTIYLGSPFPEVTDSLVITGLTCQNPVITGEAVPFSTPAFLVSPGTVPLSLSYLNIFNCVYTGSMPSGGAVQCNSLYLYECYFSGNSAVSTGVGPAKGGAVSAMSLWAANCSFISNSATYGGLTTSSGGAVNVLDSGNFYNCTFWGNSAVQSGSAVTGRPSGFFNCTVAGNSLTQGTSGGAIWSSSATPPTIANCIIWGNTSSGALSGIVFNTNGSSGGCNILQASSTDTGFTTVSSDVRGVDPMLDTLGYYSGCVPVIPIFCGSVAQNHASCAGATDTDAEGVPAYGIRDAGAFEIRPPDIGGDTIDSIQPGTTADLMNYFNTSGTTVYWLGNIPDSTQVDTGTYTIIATNFLGCSDTATVIIRYVLGTGLSLLKPGSNTLNISPNPNNGLSFNIRLPDQMKGVSSLEVADITGRKFKIGDVEMRAGNCKVVLTEGVSTGIYTVIIKSDSEEYTGTLVIMR